MSTLNTGKNGPESGRRRSQRVIINISITVSTADGPPQTLFEEVTRTLVVNAHGALIEFAGKLEKGQKVRLTNRATGATELCRVVHLGSASRPKVQYGVEFLKPSPEFWNIKFPPEDWEAPKK